MPPVTTNPNTKGFNKPPTSAAEFAAWFSNTPGGIVPISSAPFRKTDAAGDEVEIVVMRRGIETSKRSVVR